MSPYRYFVSLAISGGEAHKAAFTNAVITLEIPSTRISTDELRAIEEKFLLQFAHQGATSASLVCMEPLDVRPVAGETDMLHAQVSVILTSPVEQRWSSEVFNLHLPVAKLGTIQIREIESGFEEAYKLQGIDQATVIGLRLLSCVSTV
jgi:hypothetical protein